MTTWQVFDTIARAAVNDGLTEQQARNQCDLLNAGIRRRFVAVEVALTPRCPECDSYNVTADDHSLLCDGCDYEWLASDEVAT